jgi:hypothetical protein
VRPHRQQSFQHRNLAPEQRYLPKQARHQILPAVSAPRAGSQNREQQQKLAEEASARHLAPPSEARSQRPSAIEGPAASEADSFSFDPSSTQFRIG